MAIVTGELQRVVLELGRQMHFGAFYFTITTSAEANRSLSCSRSLLKKCMERQISNHHCIFGGDKVIGVPTSPNFFGKGM